MRRKLEQPFLKALPVLFALMKQGYEAYFVGGSVRDHIMGRTIGDIDIATSARPEQVQALFEKVIPIGIEHGTVVVQYKGDSYEVTTYRVDGDYNDFRHPDEVTYVATIEEDLSRRDFTMNAMAMDFNGEIIDPYNGQDAIHNSIIETVGEAPVRFQEDPLRMMRALRFSSQLGFTISEMTLNAIIESAYLLEKIAVERIAIEFDKLVKGENIHSSFALLIESTLVYYLPVFKNIPSLTKVINKLPFQPLKGIEEAIAIFVLSKPEVVVSTFTTEWKCSNKVKKEAEQLVNIYMKRHFKPFKWIVYQLGEDHLDSYQRLLSIIDNEDVSLEVLKENFQDLPIHSKRELALSGNDLKSWFPNCKPGPWLKTYMNQIEEDVVLGNVQNDKEAIEMWVKKWKQHEES
ncbi:MULTISPECIES: CCA tRNA nucleotidyltransferase [Pontibacillus]|uniref:CCA-adding enzyme n=1 Tax=Pontibacillus chungwhensis TaxID=265426 RepID=A0ABY8USG2_9BACI|nr:MULTISPECIES: CCA tRNA nucleotidyltransferase [Pontibacillus]MCD5322969.1 CCA tRNA nucleotidyltransferase [Pontibacillus sp. HN14]WIF96363.1 CCA tRNA nucleotidyltransferase [Pontibacillus chungwhensis]